MRVGTKSVLYGAHCFLIHPWFVALAWWRLYGFPWAPWLWVAFFVHDLGYVGKPNMDGPEGEEHPWLGAHVLYELQAWWAFLQQPVVYRHDFRGGWIPSIRWWNLRRRWVTAYLNMGHDGVCWGNEALYHSRFLAKRYGAQPSRLCFADKLSICITPWWVYRWTAGLTGEIREYRQKGANPSEGWSNEHGSDRHWYVEMQAYMRKWIEEHVDGREDTWTPSERVARDDSGVWS